MKPIRRINYSPTLAQLKRRARIHSLQIHKYERGENSFVLVDRRTNAVISTPMPFDDIETYLDDLAANTD